MGQLARCQDLCPPEHCNTLVHIDADACVTPLFCSAVPKAVARELAWAHVADANRAQHTAARTWNLMCFILPPYWLLGVIAQANLAVNAGFQRNQCNTGGFIRKPAHEEYVRRLRPPVPAAMPCMALNA